MRTNRRVFLLANRKISIILLGIMINTILFDKDGTLIDTEKLYIPTHIRTFEKLGYKLTAEQALLFRSLGAPFCEQLVNNLSGSGIDWKEFSALRKKIYDGILAENGLENKPHARESLERLAGHGYRLAIVTATPTEVAEEELERAGLLDMFEDIVSAHTVKCGKPAPDVYMYACKKLGIDPKDTIAVEDSPNGVISASDAGCNTVMIPDLTEPDEELSKRLYSKQQSLVSLADWLCGK